MPEIKFIDILRKHKLGARVGLRTEGHQVAPDIEDALRRIQEMETLIIDFADIEVMSHSFADETIAIPLSRLVAGEHGEKYLAVRIDKDELCVDLENALNKRGLVLLRLRGAGNRHWSILGTLSDELRKTAELIGNLRAVSAGDLAPRLGISLQACSNRVVELGKKRLIQRIRVEGERGVKYENVLATG